MAAKPEIGLFLPEYLVYIQLSVRVRQQSVLFFKLPIILFSICQLLCFLHHTCFSVSVTIESKDLVIQQAIHINLFLHRFLACCMMIVMSDLSFTFLFIKNEKELMHQLC